VFKLDGLLHSIKLLIYTVSFDSSVKVKDNSQQKTETEGWLHRDRRDPFAKQGWRWNFQDL